MSGKVVIVLGCRCRGGRPGAMLRGRLDKALEIIKSMPDPVIILSGGKGGDGKISEAECMARYLISRGISGDRFIKEDASRSTEENIRNCKSLIKEDQDVYIITSSFHCRRVDIVAGRYDLQCKTVPSKTPWYILPFVCIREFGALIHTRLRFILQI